MPRNEIRKAVRTRKTAPDCNGRRVKSKRYLDINAPVSDFSPQQYPKTKPKK